MEKLSDHKCTWCDGHNPDCAMCNGTGYDTDSKEAPVCPHCGAEQSTDELDRDTTIDCYNCNKEMAVEVIYDISFTTRRPKDGGKSGGG